MGDCCNSNNDTTCDIHSSPRKFTCPVNEKDYNKVPTKTVLHHIKSPWKKDLSGQTYYYCNDPDCDVVYFSMAGSVIKKNELRTRVSIKEKDENTLLCYCFGVSKVEANIFPAIKKFVIQQTKEGNCSCETSNPSGRCCLKGFP